MIQPEPVVDGRYRQALESAGRWYDAYRETLARALAAEERVRELEQAERARERFLPSEYRKVAA